MLLTPRTDYEAIERFRSLIGQRIRYQLEGCPLWKPGVLPAPGALGNCSIAFTWALGLSILQPLDTWLNSKGIFDDAVTPGGLFTKIPVAIPGCGVVFTKRPGDAAGHVGMVTEVDARGRAARVIDCSPRNGRDDSVREHGAEVFLTRPDAIYVWYTGIASTGGLPGQAGGTKPTGYAPPAESAAALAGIARLASNAKRITPRYKGLEFFAQLPSALYLQHDLDLDTDGVRDPNIDKYDETHQDQTSIGGKVNANAVNYFVLPKAFAEEYGAQLGDVAAFLYKGRVSFAAFVDRGPGDKIGEGSIALHRELGFERVKNRRIEDVGIPSGVVCVIFLGSTTPALVAALRNGMPEINAMIRAIGAPRFAQLGGALR